MHGLKVSGSMVLDDLRPYRYHKIRYKTVHCSIDLHCDALRRIHYRTTKQVEHETVSRMLGHSDIQTTQVYARVTPKKLFEDMDKYIEATKDLKLIL